MERSKILGFVLKYSWTNWQADNVIIMFLSLVLMIGNHYSNQSILDKTTVISNKAKFHYIKRLSKKL